MNYLKAKLSLIALCLMAVGGSSLYLKGIDDGIASVDEEAFNAYTHFAKQMHPELHRTRRREAETQLAQAKSHSVWDALDSRGK
ncbi:MAG TPA: hypothetical protein VHW09_27035 [Bryobacteraceae bacterium]|jgi:hypothetical protein|nr:hypothetical protein [Bryobacteraceae bacterium]